MTDEERRAIVTQIKVDLARWRRRLDGIDPGSGFDKQRDLIFAWIKEGQRLLDGIEGDLTG